MKRCNPVPGSYILRNELTPLWEAEPNHPFVFSNQLHTYCHWFTQYFRENTRNPRLRRCGSTGYEERMGRPQYGGAAVICSGDVL